MSVRFHNTSRRVLAVAEHFTPDNVGEFVTLDLRFYAHDGMSEEELSLLVAPEALAVIKAAIEGIKPAGLPGSLPYRYPDSPETPVAIAESGADLKAADESHVDF